MSEIFGNTAESGESEQVTNAPKKRGRPSKAETLANLTSRIRTPITGERSLLTVEGKQPGFHYRWIRDTDESGSEVLRYLSAGYEFATRSEGLIIGDNAVYNSRAVGSMIRRSAGRDGDFLYLMKIPQEWYEEDQRAKAVKVDKTEEAIQNPEIEGSYGSIKIS